MKGGSGLVYAPRVANSLWLPLLLASALAVPSCTTTAGRHEAWRAAMQRGARYAEDLELSAAVRQYEIALQLAATPKERIRSRIAAADLMLRPAVEGFVEPAAFELLKEGKARRQALRLYREAITIARKTPERDEELDHLEVIAVNNLATVLFLEGRFPEAARIMGETLPRVAQDDLPNYLFNYGAALEKAGRPQEAFDVFVRGGRLKVGQRAALEQAARLALEVPPTRAEANQAALIEALVEQGAYPWAEEVLEGLLTQSACRLPEGCAPIFSALARYLAAAQVDAAEFERRWWPLAGTGPAAPDSGLFAELHSVYSGELPVTVEPSRAREVFPAWAARVEDLPVLARLLNTVADQRFRARQPSAALPRYALAWALDAAQSDAGLYLFHLLALEPRELDPEGEILTAAVGRLDDDTDRIDWAVPFFRGDAHHYLPLRRPDDEARQLYLMAGNAFAGRAEQGDSGALERAAEAWSQGLRPYLKWGPWRGLTPKTLGIGDTEPVVFRIEDPATFNLSFAYEPWPTGAYSWEGDEEVALAYLTRLGEVHTRLGMTDAAARDYLAAYQLLGGEAGGEPAREMLAAAAALPTPADPALGLALTAYQSEGWSGNPWQFKAPPSLGPPDAPVTIVEFSDFQCPLCARAADVPARLRQNYRDQVRIVFRNAPMSIHPEARKAAEASLCAEEQGKFWQMRDLLFAEQESLAVAQLKEKAAKLDLDVGRFDECLDSGRYAAQVQADLLTGQALGVSGTPAFFVNGRMLSGALPYEEIFAVVEEELAAGHDNAGEGGGGS